MKIKTKNILLFCTILSLILCMFGCAPTTNTPSANTVKSIVTGGDILRYSYCILPQETHGAAIPIITTEKIDSFEFLSGEVENKDIFKISLDGIELNIYEEYKNYYIYFMGINIKNIADDNSNIVTDSVTAINMNINNKYVSYKIPHFKLSNGIPSEDGTPYVYNDRTLLFGGGGYSTLIYSHLPSDEDDMTFVGLVANSDIVIESYLIFDFVTLKSFSLREEPINNNNINASVANKENILFDYSLKYNEGVSDHNIVRVARAVIYTDNGVKKVFLDGNGVYIYPGFSDRQAVKSYIDLYLD